ncbi:uncharacterized protein BDW47DRAFT_101125 [Aspergillus candidus]|uniref:Uncharacterized protein n=1 Tax=Aspergillus candidus TaxID=41067 RepID=A0A2I2FIJ3_ASPCN|nr:hypothetical protein BDW47DRAFT_101125 [Aspergillus candidus]PLB40446.1 hypothetical protein BDW47DRAFT_101125 [Aspergillus candidus]
MQGRSALLLAYSVSGVAVPTRILSGWLPEPVGSVFQASIFIVGVRGRLRCDRGSHQLFHRTAMTAPGGVA